ncbi:hypothetical protein JTB14_005499 [Gonioctena quinquepunctata]|nr:hypothetical protein JTB14_005499 [Gonioctena quinquepunctata]
MAKIRDISHVVCDAKITMCAKYISNKIHSETRTFFRLKPTKFGSVRFISFFWWMMKIIIATRSSKFPLLTNSVTRICSNFQSERKELKICLFHVSSLALLQRLLKHFLGVMETKLTRYREIANNIKQEIVMVVMNICFAFIIFYMIVRHVMENLNLDFKKYKCPLHLLT